MNPTIQIVDQFIQLQPLVHTVLDNFYLPPIENGANPSTSISSAYLFLKLQNIPETIRYSYSNKDSVALWRLVLAQYDYSVFFTNVISLNTYPIEFFSTNGWEANRIFTSNTNLAKKMLDILYSQNPHTIELLFKITLRCCSFTNPEVFLSNYPEIFRSLIKNDNLIPYELTPTLKTYIESLAHDPVQNMNLIKQFLFNNATVKMNDGTLFHYIYTINNWNVLYREMGDTSGTVSNISELVDFFYGTFRYVSLPDLSFESFEDIYTEEEEFFYLFEQA